MILAGGAFERGSILPSLIFSFFWATIVYCPLARWTWSSNGWLYTFGAIDFAGGGPVHIASGCSALAYAMVLGKRVLHGEPSLRKPHNTTLVFLGTVLIWTGWLGFNVCRTKDPLSVYVPHWTNYECRVDRVSMPVCVLWWLSLTPTRQDVRESWDGS
jgi:ammonia channel protein AmtB